jgi:hypothetical protein
MRLSQFVSLSQNLVQAGLQQELLKKMDSLLSNFKPEDALKIHKWFLDNFRVKVPRTPKGQKKLKENVNKWLWWLGPGGTRSYRNQPDVLFNEIKREWEEDIKPHVADLVKHFSDEGGKIVPKEIKSGNILYLNLIGFEKSKFEKYVKQLDALFKSIKGWRRKAFTGTLKVALAGPKHFRGTSSGVYKSAEDTLYVRATPKVLKRAEGYGSPHYVLVHELGHRFDYKVRPTTDFDRQQWQTTNYSMKDGEAFAELFALGHFGIKKAHRSWDPAIQEKFETLMKGGKLKVRPEMPEHLRQLVKPKWKTLSPRP